MTRKISKNNKSGYRGVCFEKKAYKYRAYINMAGEKIRLGYFDTVEDAYSARKEAEEIYDLRTDGTFRIVDYAISKKQGLENYDLGVCGLIESMAKYEFGGTSFIVFAFRRIKYGDFKADIKFKEVFNSLNMFNDDIIVKWLDGYTIRQLSKLKNMSVPNTSAYVKDKINKLKNKLKENNLL